ncbi:MAG: carboxypeptidase regulatory-like domain-containing protein, partial [Acidobacteriaceae bacterium]
MGFSRLPEFVLPRLHYRCLRSFAGVIAMLMSVSLAVAQHTDGGVIRGTVVNSAGNVVRDASVTLEQGGVPGARETKTNAAGVFAFSALPIGSYQLSAHKAELRTRPATVKVGSSGGENHVDLVLDDAQSSTQAMEFADKPNFTVAGVTDWTAVGGHGSDSTLRTSEALARETVTLKPDDPAKHGDDYDLALAYKESGDYAGAREQIQKLLAKHDTADLHRLLGELDEKTGDPLGAVHEDEQAVRLLPSEQNYFAWGSELL